MTPFILAIIFNRAQTIKKGHTCVYTPHVTINRINDHFFQATLQVRQKFRNYVKSFPIVRNERWACTADLWVETSPSTNDNSLCRLRKKSARNVCRTRPTRRRESHPLFRLLSAFLLSCPIFLIKLRHTMRRPLNGLLFNCCKLIERMIYVRGSIRCEPFLPISFGLVMLLHNSPMFTEHYYQSEIGIEV